MGIDARMFVRTAEKLTPEIVLKRAHRLAAAFGRERFFIQKEGKCSHHCLEIVDAYHQDGPTLNPEPGESFIVSLCSAINQAQEDGQ